MRLFSYGFAAQATQYERLEELGILANNQIQSNKIQVDIVNQTLIARKLVESERTEKINNAINHVFETYDDVFVALAEGAT